MEERALNCKHKHNSVYMLKHSFTTYFWITILTLIFKLHCGFIIRALRAAFTVLKRRVQDEEIIYWIPLDCHDIQEVNALKMEDRSLAYYLGFSREYWTSVVHEGLKNWSGIRFKHFKIYYYLKWTLFQVAYKGQLYHLRKIISR